MMTQLAKMRGAVIIFYFVVFLFEGTSGNATHKMQPKIIGGHSIDIRFRPFMLSLHNSHRFLCGANILSRTWAITALHCFDSILPTRYYVRAGSNKIDRSGSVHRVTNICVYNSTYIYDSGSRFLNHDIALFRVRPPFQFSRTVRPVHLPRSTHGIPRELLVCGWGYTEKNEPSETLMGVYVQHVPHETCVNITSFYARNVKDDYHLCYGSQGKDACFGDSGGALASKNTIYGIVIFGEGCGKVAGVYARVSYYREWINTITNL